MRAEYTFTTIEDLQRYLKDHPEVMKANERKKGVHKEFREAAKRILPFIAPMLTKVEFKIYLHAIENGITEPPQCIVCGEPVKTVHSGVFPKTCCKHCTAVYRAKIVSEECYKQHGVHHHQQRPEIKEKTKKFLDEKYGNHPMRTEKTRKAHRESIRKSLGVDNPFQSEEIKERIKSRRVRSEGVEYPQQIPEVRERTLRTVMKRYGGSAPSQNPEVMKKTRDTMNRRYGGWYSTTEKHRAESRERLGREMPTNRSRGHVSQESLDILRCPKSMKKLYEEVGVLAMMNMLNVNDATIFYWTGIHGIDTSKTSFLEKSFENFLVDSGLEGDFINNDRKILGGKELDFYFPEKKIAVEINGLYWHCSAKVETLFHLRKTEQCASQGIQLIHIFEDEWLLRRRQCERKILSVFGIDPREKIYARKTKFSYQRQSSEELSEFFEENHIQGNAHGSFYSTLREGRNIVAAAIFRRDGNNSDAMQLSRYATSKRVPGGLSKIMKNMTPILQVEGYIKVISFADRRWSDGGAYEASGWTFEGNTRPDYQYVVGGERIRKQNFRRKQLPRKLQNFDPSLSEVKNMRNHGIYQIFDCGLMRYSLDITPDN